MYSNDPHQTDDMPCLDEHTIQLTGQLYRDGSSDLQVDDLTRNRHKVTFVIFITEFMIFFRPLLLPESPNSIMIVWIIFVPRSKKVKKGTTVLMFRSNS